MKYEICRRDKENKNVWSPVAWSDTWKWANEIARSLNCVSDGEFAVFAKGKRINSLEEAMRC